MATESQFILAYDAAHAASRAALRAHGYRSEDRYLVFQCLEHTIGWPTEKSAGRRVSDGSARFIPTTLAPLK